MTDVETKQSFEDAIKQHLIDNRSELVGEAVRASMNSLSESLKYTALDAAKKQLTTFFTEQVAPEVAKFLDAEKETLVASVVSTIKECVDYGLKKQAEDWMKEMDSAYGRSGTIQKMFGGKSY